MAGLVATITSLAYTDTVTVDVETPLGVFPVEQPADVLTLTFDVKNIAEQTLQFSPEAVGNRMAGYLIDDVVAAVESIVREVVFGWSPDLAPADLNDQAAVNGGLDERVGVVWTADASQQATDVLDPLADRIYAARDAFAAPAGPAL